MLLRKMRGFLFLLKRSGLKIFFKEGVHSAAFLPESKSNSTGPTGEKKRVITVNVGSKNKG